MMHKIRYLYIFTIFILLAWGCGPMELGPDDPLGTGLSKNTSALTQQGQEPSEDLEPAENAEPESDSGEAVSEEVTEGEPAPESACTDGQSRACYNGPIGTQGVGLCQAGTQVCAQGTWSACTGATLPSLETCDDQDNDCDGQIDEDFTTKGTECTAGTGTCQAMGNWVCKTDGSDVICNATPGTPSTELCDGLDNDCDGQIDEDFSQLGQNCQVGQGECLRNGQYVCKADHSGTTCSQQAGTPTAELCDGKDNDCDGLVDEDLIQNCYTGPQGTNGVGVCMGGTQICQGGTWGTCTGQVLPSTEICDDQDNDCDGAYDENLTKSCYTGPQGTAEVGTCKNGTQTCQWGQWGTCQGQVLPSTEICDNKDNDCDGQIDESLTKTCYSGPLGTADIGVCKSGTQTCQAGVWGTCTGEVLPSTEICDDQDNDCDGEYDENLTRSCYNGPQGTAGVGICKSGSQTCYLGQWGICQGEQLPAAEVCDGKDNSCNGQIDDTCLPPDPKLRASEWTQNTGFSPFDKRVEFLYTGQYPTQTGVSAGTIEKARAGAVYGYVKDLQGQPISGVKVTILGHTEFGQTLSRQDGRFDMAVNTGQPLTIRYKKAGYPMVQRTINPQQLFYTKLADVYLTPYDNKVSKVDLTKSLQVARGSISSDQDGSRQGTLFFKQGTTANLVFANGSKQSISVLDIRITEYTVGTTGSNAMPGTLPPTSAYTYAAEYSVDQAVALGAVRVEFSQPVISYLENFIQFPVGGGVPVGYYDHQKGAWVASKDGRIIKILSIQNGVARLDLNGQGIEATAQEYQAKGIDQAEREQLAKLYTAGTSLWRVPVPHFSPWDFNWPFGIPSNQTGPVNPPAYANNQANQNTCRPGSIIHCQDRKLGETLGVTGAPFSLHYQSDRVMGRRTAFSMKIPITGATPPTGIEDVFVEVSIAGQTHRFVYPMSIVTANMFKEFEWDGKDQWGNIMNSPKKAHVKVGYTYRALPYRTLQEAIASFASVPTSTGIVGSFNRASRPTFELTQEYDVILGIWRAKGQFTFGGWTPSIVHSYDPVHQVLYYGSGAHRNVSTITGVHTFAGTGNNGLIQENKPANTQPVTWVEQVTGDSKGNIYILNADVSVGISGAPGILKVTPNGNISTLVGTTTNAKYATPGQNATSIAVSPSGELYFSTYSMIYKVDEKAGQLVHIAGSTAYNPSTNHIPAKQANLNHVISLAFDQQGTLYICEHGSHRVRKLDPNGTIINVAGTGNPGFSGDGGVATNAELRFPYGIQLDSKGNLYIADMYNHRVRKVRTDGIIETFAGSGVYGFAGDGGQAKQAQIAHPQFIAIDKSNEVFISTPSHAVVRKVDARGKIDTVLGTGHIHYAKEGTRPKKWTGTPYGLYIDIFDTVYIAGMNRVFRWSKPLEKYGATSYVIPSQSGRRAYIFDGTGRHKQTLDALNKKVIYNFEYDTKGRLTKITDILGKVTTIQRNTNGQPISITSPYGDKTTLLFNNDGYLQSVTNPANEKVTLTYHAKGLLATLQDAKGQIKQFTHDAKGYLQSDQDAKGASQTLTMTKAFPATSPNGDVRVRTIATFKTGEGYASTYQTEFLHSGDQRREDTEPGGVKTLTTLYKDGSSKTTYPNGTITTTTMSSDTRWFNVAPILSRVETKLPGGQTFVTTTTRSVTQATPGDILSVSKETEVVSYNGRNYTSVHDVTNKTYTETTPEGRKTITTLDAFHRPVHIQEPGVNAISYTYNTNGRITKIASGTGSALREVTFVYNSKNRLEKTTDQLGRNVLYSYDAVGRVLSKTYANNDKISYQYDKNGHRTSVTLANGKIHSYTYDAVGLVSQYTAPQVGTTATTTQYLYNKDKKLTQLTMPSGQKVQLTYDTAGRVSTVVTPRGTTSIQYDATSGQLKEFQGPGGEKLQYTYNGTLVTQSTWTGTVAGNVSYDYDNNFRITALKVNGSTIAQYTYDNDSLLTQTDKMSLTLDASSGRVNGSTLTNISSTRSYDSFGHLSQLQSSYQGTTLSQFKYTRDKLGRITQVEETIQGTQTTYSYTYDLRGRLSTIKKNGSLTNTYAYDKQSNRLSDTPAGQSAITGTYDAQDRLLTYGSNTYAYDANGSLLTKTTGAQSTQYKYDLQSQLLSITLPSNKKIEYILDASGRRVGKKVNGSQTKGWLYMDQLNPIAELDSSNNVVTTFVYATRGNVPSYMVKSGMTYRIISDHRGSVRLVVNASTGQVVQRMDYDEWGRVLQDTNPGFQPFGYAGGLYDSDTGLVRFGARDYDATIGRWLSKDPSGLDGGLNLYEYAGSDPVNYIDVNGRIPFLIILATASWKGKMGYALAGIVIGAVILMAGLETQQTPESFRKSWGCNSKGLPTAIEVNGVLEPDDIDAGTFDVYGTDEVQQAINTANKMNQHNNELLESNCFQFRKGSSKWKFCTSKHKTRDFWKQ